MKSKNEVRMATVRSLLVRGAGTAYARTDNYAGNGANQDAFIAGYFAALIDIAAELLNTDPKEDA